MIVFAIKVPPKVFIVCRDHIPVCLRVHGGDRESNSCPSTTAESYSVQLLLVAFTFPLCLKVESITVAFLGNIFWRFGESREVGMPKRQGEPRGLLMYTTTNQMEKKKNKKMRAANTQQKKNDDNKLSTKNDDNKFKKDDDNLPASPYQQYQHLLPKSPRKEAPSPSSLGHLPK